MGAQASRVSNRNHHVVRAWFLRAVVAAWLLVAAPVALADVSNSTNWAGYAVHRHGVSFQDVTGTWRQPALACQTGRQTFSSFWVGLGGYNPRSRALEQTGTEADCTRRGTVRTFAWFELVPRPSVRIRLNVPPGDLIQAGVAVAGHRVRISLRDLTRHRS